MDFWWSWMEVRVFRSSSSVRPCLDLVCNLLPSPQNSSELVKKSIGNHFSGLLFKIIHDKRKGRIGYTRVYSGELKGGSHVWNWTRGEKEGPIELFEAQSDSLDPIKSAKEGDIIAVRGLEKSLTGDSFISIGFRDCDKRIIPEENAGSHIIFDGIDQPDPVFYCSIEPPDMKKRHALERALKELVVEDPSLRVREDTESGQTILETMGELHVEIVKDRLVRGYGLNVFLGPLQVSYREVVQNTVEHIEYVEDTVDGRTYSASVKLRIEPEEGLGKWKKLKMDLPPGTRLPRPDWQQGLREGVSSALHHGPLLSFPVYDVSVSLLELNVSGGKVGANLVCAAAHKCIEMGLKRCGVRLVEPVMEVELTLPADCPSQSVLHELTRRRATIDEMSGDDERESKIRATLPLSSLAGLSSAVRTLSRGLSHLNYARPKDKINLMGEIVRCEGDSYQKSDEEIREEVMNRFERLGLKDRIATASYLEDEISSDGYQSMVNFLYRLSLSLEDGEILKQYRSTHDVNFSSLFNSDRNGLSFVKGNKYERTQLPDEGCGHSARDDCPSSETRVPSGNFSHEYLPLHKARTRANPMQCAECIDVLISFLSHESINHELMMPIIDLLRFAIEKTLEEAEWFMLSGEVSELRLIVEIGDGSTLHEPYRGGRIEGERWRKNYGIRVGYGKSIDKTTADAIMAEGKLALMRVRDPSLNAEYSVVNWDVLKEERDEERKRITMTIQRGVTNEVINQIFKDSINGSMHKRFAEMRDAIAAFPDDHLLAVSYYSKKKGAPHITLQVSGALSIVVSSSNISIYTEAHKLLSKLSQVYHQISQAYLCLPPLSKGCDEILRSLHKGLAEITHWVGKLCGHLCTQVHEVVWKETNKEVLRSLPSFDQIFSIHRKSLKQLATRLFLQSSASSLSSALHSSIDASSDFARNIEGNEWEKAAENYIDFIEAAQMFTHGLMVDEDPFLLRSQLLFLIDPNEKFRM
uniref:Uncharacterized protein n=1 Tax=Pristionchus pacificus TaxID=54126 RepID=A0A2A6BDZ1_PRIPA|eukprot:PDM64115.1 hypothetical protein PRIPAC_54359 [Pristionchus pacificus]